MVSLAWGNLKKPLVDCVVQIDHAVANRFPRARERISSAAEGLQASTGKHSSLVALPLGLGRALGISLLERTEALLDSLLPMQSVTVFTTESSSPNGKVQDEDNLSDKIKEDKSDRKKDDSQSLPLFRMVAVKLSSGSHSLQVTVISVQDTCEPETCCFRFHPNLQAASKRRRRDLGHSAQEHRVWLQGSLACAVQAAR
mmetsp:Transcript_7666/g.11043  ORF Transcript_7666/g.11043 Transcript_7666/m.11043 type:complete len:199 (-) Transcript_7666:60-656(-)